MEAKRVHELAGEMPLHGTASEETRRNSSTRELKPVLAGDSGMAMRWLKFSFSEARSEDDQVP